MALFSPLNNGDDLNTNVRRVGSRRPGPTAPNGESLGDLWYDTSALALKVWNGTAWVGVASSGGGGLSYITPGLEIYHPASTPYIDFHRAADPAGDSNADFNIRFINDADNVLRLSTLSAVNSNTGGRLHIGNAFIGSHPVHGGGNWAAFGHQNRLATGDYQYMANTDGDTLINSGGIGRIRMFINGASERMLADLNAVHWSSILAMRDNVIHLRAWNDTNHRIEYQSGVDATNHTMNSNIRFASTSVYVAQITVGGEIIARLQDGNSRIRLGSWPPNGVFGGIYNQIRLDNNNNHYMLMTSNSDDDMYTSASGGNGAILWRRPNNGLTHASLGINNRGMSTVDTFDLAIPALGGGNTMNVQANGNWQVGWIASTGKFKKNVRLLRETPELDAAEHNPIFKMKVKRFNWKQDELDPKRGWQGKGVANGDELNALFPNGVVGLIVEEIEDLAPDCVIHGGKDEEPWDVTNPEHGKLPWIDPDTGKPATHMPGWPHGPIGIDNDRLIAYVIDATQHLKEENDLGKLEIKALKEEIKKIKEKVIL